MKTPDAVVCTPVPQNYGGQRQKDRKWSQVVNNNKNTGVVGRTDT